MSNEISTKPISARVSPDIYQRIQRKSLQLGITKSEIVALALAEFFNEERTADSISTSHQMLAEQIKRITAKQDQYGALFCQAFAADNTKEMREDLVKRANRIANLIVEV